MSLRIDAIKVNDQIYLHDAYFDVDKNVSTLNKLVLNVEIFVPENINRKVPLKIILYDFIAYPKNADYSHMECVNPRFLRNNDLLVFDPDDFIDPCKFNCKKIEIIFSDSIFELV